MKNDLAIFFSLSAEAKIAFLEWMGRKEALLLSGEALKYAENGLNLVSRWRKNKDVSGDEIHLTLMNNYDQGLFAFQDSRTPRVTDSAIDVIGGAISYAAWQAYEREGNGFPQGYDQMSDDFIGWIFDQADASGVFAEGEMRKMLTYIAGHYSGEEMKGFIDLSNMNLSA